MHRTSPEALTRRASSPPSPTSGRGFKTKYFSFLTIKFTYRAWSLLNKAIELPSPAGGRRVGDEGGQSKTPNLERNTKQKTPVRAKG